jgi:hypothetical protein
VYYEWSVGVSLKSFFFYPSIISSIPNGETSVHIPSPPTPCIFIIQFAKQTKIKKQQKNKKTSTLLDLHPV